MPVFTPLLFSQIKNFEIETCLSVESFLACIRECFIYVCRGDKRILHNILFLDGSLRSQEEKLHLMNLKSLQKEVSFQKH